MVEKAPFSSAFQPLIDRREMAGAIALLADRNRVLHQEAVGYAHLVSRKPLRLDSLFWIASMTKPITATAVMLLADKGKLNPDDPVEKYLPELKHLWLVKEKEASRQVLVRPSRKVTLRHLLTHASGMPIVSGVEDPEFAATGKFGKPIVLLLKEAVASYAMTPLEFEPGEKWQYSNAGYNTLGRVIEVVSGMPYEVFLQKRLFEPLGMRETTFSPTKRQVARLATAYKLSAMGSGLEETPIPSIPYPLGERTNLPWPAGGLFSTAADMTRFCQLYLNKGVWKGRRILSEAAIQRMVGRPDWAGNNPVCLLGWFVNPDQTFGHNGAFSTVMTLDPVRGMCKILLQQHAAFPGDSNPVIEAFDRVAKDTFRWGER